MSATIIAICTSEKRGTRKAAIQSANLIAGHGIEGDAHAGDWHRQVSLLALADTVEIRKKLNFELTAGDFAENLLLGGLEVGSLGLGSVLRLGATAQLRITQIGKVCHEHCEIYRQAGDCVMPRRGLFAEVLVGGVITQADPVKILHLVPREQFQAVVLTASDRCSIGQAVDTAGPAVAQLFQQRLGARLHAAEILPDDRAQLAARLRHYSSGHTVDLIAVVGGTGFAPRDVTPEAVREVAERLTPGLDEAMRSASLAKTPHAMLSRAVSGIRGSTLIISLPGSERAAVENLEAILPGLDHGLRKLRGDPADCGRPPIATANRVNMQTQEKP